MSAERREYLVAGEYRLGRRLVAGRYRLCERKLGQGGMGAVWPAFDEQMGRDVAVKLLHQDAEDWQRDYFVREVTVCAALLHERITVVFDGNREGDRHYLVMELVDGISLADELGIAQAPVPVLRAVDLLAQILEGLDYAHGKGIIHRDLKPGNIMVTRERGKVKICDFGIARFLHDTARNGKASTRPVGTVWYMAPEQLLDRTVDHRADLYALGCLAYELLTGSPPFKRSNEMAAAYAQVHEQPVPMAQHRADIPAALESLVLQLLAKRPDQRPSSAAEVGQELRRLLAGPLAGRLVPSPDTVPGGARSGGHGHTPTEAVPLTPRPRPLSREPTARFCVHCRTGTIDADGYCQNCGRDQPRERDHLERELDGSIAAAVSDRGLHQRRNEDAFALSTTALPGGSSTAVVVVCDGVLSAPRADEASECASIAACRALGESLRLSMDPQHAMREALISAAHAVCALASTSGVPAGTRQAAPACTIVSGVIANGILTVGWIGDSRAYWIPDDRSGPAVRLTVDDSWAAQMVAAHAMTEADAYADARARVLTGWLGADAREIAPHTASFQPDRPGVVVVCTGGLWHCAEAAADMAAAVPADSRTKPLHAARLLVEHALDRGGNDNVTVAVLPFPGP